MNIFTLCHHQTLLKYMTMSAIISPSDTIILNPATLPEKERTACRLRAHACKFVCSCVRMFVCSCVRMFVCSGVRMSSGSARSIGGVVAHPKLVLRLPPVCANLQKPENKNDGKCHVKGLNNYGGSPSYPYSLLLWLHCTD